MGELCRLRMGFHKQVLYICKRVLYITKQPCISAKASGIPALIWLYLGRDSDFKPGAKQSRKNLLETEHKQCVWHDPFVCDTTHLCRIYLKRSTQNHSLPEEASARYTHEWVMSQMWTVMSRMTRGGKRKLMEQQLCVWPDIFIWVTQFIHMATWLIITRRILPRVWQQPGDAVARYTWTSHVTHVNESYHASPEKAGAGGWGSSLETLPHASAQ